jgi:hypothetical protein
MSPFAKSGCRRWRKDRNARLIQSGRNRRPSLETLEKRALLAIVTVTNDLDGVDGDTSSISALLADPGTDGISLREAIEATNATSGADIIGFDTSLFATGAQTINLSGTQLGIGDDLTIFGPGADLLAIDGPSNSRVMRIESGSTATISGLTLTGGSTTYSYPGSWENGYGGAIFNAGDLTLQAVSIENNHASLGAGGVYVGSSATLTMENSTVAENEVGGGGYGGGAIYLHGTANILNSTLSNNDAPTAGAIYVHGGTLTTTNSTISANDASSSIGGIYASGTVTLHNTIVAENTGGSYPDVYGTFQSASSYNLIGVINGSSGLTGNNTNYGTSSSPLDPDLASLANNGGPTRTHALLSSSPAVDAGSDTVAQNAGLTTDQRGFERFIDTVDVGAYEFQPVFELYSLIDASLDDSVFTAFEDGAQRLSYSFFDAGIGLTQILLEAVQGSTVQASWPLTQASETDYLVGLNDSGLAAGTYDFRAKAVLNGSQTIFSDALPFEILDSNLERGTFEGETFGYSALGSSDLVLLGAGGTDTLNMGLSTSAVDSLNGGTLASFDVTDGATMDQAIFHGTAFDFLRLTDGREIYLQGIERLAFTDGVVEMQVAATDPGYAGQWNLHTQDVRGAWRFTQGDEDVLLVSLDTGVLTPVGRTGGVFDLDNGRLITDVLDDDDYTGVFYGHGHKAISIMSAVPNNGENIAGINWVSDVMVADVYNDGVSFHQAIEDAVDFARDEGLRIVFQGGVQGNSWLTDGGTRAELEDLIQDNADISLYAVAAGNNGGAVNGVAALQTTHENVIAVGAATRSLTTVHGLTNVSDVFRASYSQNGPDLTLMASTDVPSVDKFGNTVNFNGTSAANPNMAGIASLVWSINPNFDGGDVRQTLIETAMDIDDTGWDNDTAFGLVNAEAAARRALAWVRDAELAALADSDDLMMLHNGIVLEPPSTPPEPFDDSSSGQLPPPNVATNSSTGASTKLVDESEALTVPIDAKLAMVLASIDDDDDWRDYESPSLEDSDREELVVREDSLGLELALDSYFMAFGA